MSRRLAALAFALLALAVSGCGGSSDSAPAPAPSPSAQVRPASTATALDAAQGERKDERRQLREFGQAAARACKKAVKRYKPWVLRLEKAIPSGKKDFSRAEVRRIGTLIGEFAEGAEYEYELLREIPLPENAEAQYTVFEFFDQEEEGLSLIHRIGAELRQLADRDSILSADRRYSEWLPQYRRAARAAYAQKCYDPS